MIELTACSSQNKPKLDGASLLAEKCASCHNLDIPPKTHKDEKAPPMMAVAFHIKDFIKVSTPSDKQPKFIAFFQDFVLHPSLEKSFCDKESLNSYGLMPSQEGRVTKEEIGAIATYAYEYYDQDKFLVQMQKKSAFDALPKGEQIATKKGCLTCHGIKFSKAAPSFSQMSEKKSSTLMKIIQNGSKGKWKGFEKMIMPPFANSLNEEELTTLVHWIQTTCSK